MDEQLTRRNPVSTVLRMGEEYPLHERPEVMRISGEALNGEGVLFNPLPGFHFGVCGPLAVRYPFANSFLSDVPVLIAVLVLDGCFRFREPGGAGEYTDIRRNMFLLGLCSGAELDFFYPAQELYSHIGLIVPRARIGEVLGAGAEAWIARLLQDRPGACGAGPALSHGVAGPELMTIAGGLRQIHRGGGALELLRHRSAALDLFVKLFSSASAAGRAQPQPLPEQDRRRAEELKRRIEERYLHIESAEEVCSSLGMSLKKANKAFQALYFITIAKYIHHCKMAHAHAMLSSRRLNVSECAYEVGYSNVSHFIAAFKKQYGVTPKAASRACADLATGN